MIIRVASRLILLLASLALATALVVGALSALASTAPAGATPLPEHDQVAAVERAVEVPADAEQAATYRPPPWCWCSPGSSCWPSCRRPTASTSTTAPTTTPTGSSDPGGGVGRGPRSPRPTLLR